MLLAQPGGLDLPGRHQKVEGIVEHLVVGDIGISVDGAQPGDQQVPRAPRIAVKLHRAAAQQLIGIEQVQAVRKFVKSIFGLHAVDGNGHGLVAVGGRIGEPVVDRKVAAAPRDFENLRRKLADHHVGIEVQDGPPEFLHHMVDEIRL
jgi:hypothetical protein